MADARRLAELSMPTELAKETASQIAAATTGDQTAIAAIVELTAATGTGSDTIADVGGSFSQTTLNNNFKSLADKVNEIIAALQG